MWSLQGSKRVPSDRRPAHSLRHACIIKFGAFKPLSVESKCPVQAARSVEKWLYLQASSYAALPVFQICNGTFYFASPEKWKQRLCKIWELGGGMCGRGGGGGQIRCIMGDVQMGNGTLSSLVALRHVLHPQIRWRRLCDEPKERLRGKVKTLEIYWDLEITILGLFCLNRD